MIYFLWMSVCEVHIEVTEESHGGVFLGQALNYKVVITKLLQDKIFKVFELL